MRVVERINQLLKAKKIKKKDIAKAIDLTPSLVSKLFTGHSRMNLSQLDSICSYMGIEMSDLLYESEKPDSSTYYYSEEESENWCSNELGIYLLIILLKGSYKEAEILHHFRGKEAATKKQLQMLIQKNLIIKRPDHTLAINPPNYTSYNLSKSNKLPTCLANIIKIHIEKFLNSTEEWKKNTVSFARSHINWFTEAQLNYVKEQIQNLDEILTNFLVENRRKNYRDAKYLQLISIESIQMMKE